MTLNSQYLFNIVTISAGTTLSFEGPGNRITLPPNCDIQAVTAEGMKSGQAAAFCILGIGEDVGHTITLLKGFVRAGRAFAYSRGLAWYGRISTFDVRQEYLFLSGRNDTAADVQVLVEAWAVER